MMTPCNECTSGVKAVGFNILLAILLIIIYDM